MERRSAREDVLPRVTKLPLYVWVAAGLLAGTAFFLWSGSRGSPVGPLPALALVDADGRPVEKAWFREGTTVMFLFLPGEARSDAQAKALEAVRPGWEAKGVRVLGVSLAASEGLTASRVAALGLQFRVVHAKGNVLEALSVRGVPSSLLVNRHAQVVARAEGIHGPEELDEALGRTVAGP